MVKESPNRGIHDITVTFLHQTRRQWFQPDPNLLVVTIDGRQKLIDLNETQEKVFSNTSVPITLEHASSVLFAVCHKGVLGKKSLGTVVMNENDFSKYSPGTHKLCLDLVIGRKVTPMQLSFSLDVPSQDAKKTEQPARSLTGSAATSTAIGSALGTVANLSGGTVMSDDTVTTVQSANSTAESVAAYYAPLGQALELVDRVLNAVEAFSQVHVIVHTAYLALSSAYWVVRKQMVLDISVKKLAEAMVNLFSWAKEAQSLDQKVPQFTKIIELMAQQATECAVFIKDYSSRGFLGRTMHSNVNVVDQTVQDFLQIFDALLNDFDRGAVVSTFRLLTRADTAIRDLLDRQEDSQARDGRKELIKLLERGLPRVSDAYFDPNRTCLNGTRQATLSEIYGWSSKPGGQSVYWLRAEAGTGKSTISHTVADRAAKLGQLGGCFFLHRDYADRRHPRLIVNTLAFRLAYFHPDIAAGIKAALDKDPDLGRIDSIQIQFDRLILDPISAVKNLVEPILLVIDDLDALDTKDDDAHRRRREFLDYISRNHLKFPPILKIFMTSRPDRDISFVLKGVEACSLPHDSVDIARLARKLLDEVAERYRLTCPWPEATILEALVKRSGRLFIWIRIACAFIAQRDPSRRLRLVLEGDPPQGAGEELNKLYRDALLNHAEKEGDDDDEFYERFRKIMGCIANLRNPLTPEAIDSLLGFPADIQSRYTIELLESFLSVTEEGVVRPIHPSFIEFLTNEQRCKSRLLFVGEEHSRNLGKRCMEVMQTLKRNVCDLENPLTRNNSETKERIPKDLLYACRFWSHHLQSLHTDYDLYCIVEDFFLTKVLFWLEVVSLAGLVDEAIPSLDAARRWVDVLAFTLVYWHRADQTILFKGSTWKSAHLLSLISDTRKFIEEFRPILLKSAGYIYESALPCTPHGTLLFQQGSKHAGKIPSVHGAYRDWESHRIVELRSEPVKSAAWSPDSTKIAISTRSHGIYIYDAKDGSFIGEVLRGHTDVVSVAFSPDGKHVASGSWDQTIGIWDIDNNVLLRKISVGSAVFSVAFSPDGTKIISATQPVCSWNVNDGTLVLRFGQPNNLITSVAYSPDGTRIVSGSETGEIVIWNAMDGSPIGTSFVGHNGYISSVAFSADGGRVVSGCDDTTVRVWNANDGTLVVNPLTGHHDNVYSVAISPDGTKIVSGSNDGTVRIWDAINGTLSGRPLMQHRSPVHTVSFSPNGTQLLSGASDATIRIWNTVDATLQGEFTDGHSDSVVSVCFSPDGSKIVSGSWDSTVCLWSAVDGTVVGAPRKGHTSTVFCVKFSPDGRCIASGSWDSTVRIWRADEESNGNLLLEGHRDRVWALEFSPDGKRLVSSSSDSTLRIWSVADGKPVSAPLEGETASTMALAFSPDGSKIISADKSGSIRVWDASDGTLIRRLRGHSDNILGLSFSPDGMQIISGSHDRTIRVWDTRGSLLSSYPQHFFESFTGTALPISNNNTIPESTLALFDMLRTGANGLMLLGGWIRVPGSSKRLWIPPRYRGMITVNANRVCAGTSTGHIVIFETAMD